MAGDKFSENGVLINKLGITDPKELSQAETDSALPKLARLNMQGGIPGGQYDQTHFKEVHKKLFEDVYQWAGETRADREFQGNKETRVTGYKEVMTFGPHKEIEARLGAIGEQLGKENNLKGLDQDKFTERAAYYLDQYNHTHAFREGNGRTVQALMTQLGKEAGYQIDFGKTDPAVLNRARDEAMVRLYPPAEADRNLKQLKDMFQQVTTPAPGEADRNLKQLKDMFQQVTTPAPGEAAEKLRAPSQAVPTPELSPAMRAMDARRELEVSGYRAANIIANMPGAGNYDQGVKLAQRITNISTDLTAIKGLGITEMQFAAQKILKHPDMQDMTLDLSDAKRLRTSSMQVVQLAEGKELVAAPHQQAASVPAPKQVVSPAAIQPKTHEEAQPVFIAAARNVAKELEANGEGSAGAHLREVAKFVERSPFIAGQNQENVHKALDAADKVPGLSGSKDLGELRNSVSVLEKEPKSQGRSSPSDGRNSGGIER